MLYAIILKNVEKILDKCFKILYKYVRLYNEIDFKENSQGNNTIWYYMDI
ncbi:hypothetical protein FACS1894151_03310 [Spirochaetia bacterium]|nr:hypothetical protein FACS1894151_03310 [Spirochaetia bacterium]